MSAITRHFQDTPLHNSVTANDVKLLPWAVAAVVIVL
jgi:hypothetical protein